MKPVSGLQIICLILLALILAGMASSEWARQLDQFDRALMRGYFGQKITERIQQEAVTPLQSQDSGSVGFVIVFSNLTHHPFSVPPTPELLELERWGSDRIVLFESFVERVIRRMLVLETFWPLAVLLFLTALWDGILCWQAKRTSFAYSSPLAHRATILFFCVLSVSLLFGIVAPLPFFPGWIPIHLTLIAWAIRFHIVHLPKRL